MKRKGLLEFLFEEDAENQTPDELSSTDPKDTPRYFIYFGRFDTQRRLDSVALLEAHSDKDGFYFINLTSKRDDNQLDPNVVLDNGILFELPVQNKDQAITQFSSLRNVLNPLIKGKQFIAKPIMNQEFSADSARPIPGNEKAIDVYKRWSLPEIPNRTATKGMETLKNNS